MKLSIFLHIGLLPILFFGLNLVFIFLGWYDSILILDNVMHFTAGMVIARSGKLFIEHFNPSFLAKKSIILLDIILLISAVSLVAVCWEFAEFTSDYLLHSQLQSDLEDTLLDLLLGVSGASIAAVWYGVRR